MAQKWPKTAQIWFWCAHMVKTIGNYVWKNFQKFSAFFDRFWSIFIFSLKIHDFSKKNLKNSKKHFFDLWDLLWWVFHMVLALNHWFRPKNEGSKKSVPRNYKSAGSNALKKTVHISQLCAWEKNLIYAPFVILFFRNSMTMKFWFILKSLSQYL